MYGVFLQGGTLCLEVEDTGIGMPEEDAQAMRRRMNGAEISQLRKKGRVGILNACIRLKMATGDRVRFELESEENVGTTVTVLLPAEGWKRGIYMLKVMLVDDEPFILRGLSLLIDWREQGFEIVKTASNGLDALEYLRREKVHLVLADIRMPGMTGLELVETLRKEQGAKRPYFAIMSGYNDFEYARQAICNACLDYILKPVSAPTCLRCSSACKSSTAKRRRKRPRRPATRKPSLPGG